MEEKEDQKLEVHVTVHTSPYAWDVIETAVKEMERIQKEHSCHCTLSVDLGGG